MRLYKYATWRPFDKGCEENKQCEFINKCYTKENLLNNVWFFNSPDNFNDPFDTLANIKTDCKPETIMEYMVSGYMMSENIPRQVAEQKALEKLKTSKLFSDIPTLKRSAEEVILEYRKRTGVCCFTSNKPDTLLMWSHYADKHRGICLEFEITTGKVEYQIPNSIFKIIIAGVFKMKYQKKLPIFNFFEFEGAFELLTTKHRRWIYEQEYRLISLNYTGPVGYLPEHLVGVYAGCNIGDNEFIDLQTTIKNLKSSPVLYRTTIKKEDYGLDIEKI